MLEINTPIWKTIVYKISNHWKTPIPRVFLNPPKLIPTVTNINEGTEVDSAFVVYRVNYFEIVYRDNFSMLSSPNTVMINTLYTIYTQCNIHLIQAPLKNNNEWTKNRIW